MLIAEFRAVPDLIPGCDLTKAPTTTPGERNQCDGPKGQVEHLLIELSAGDGENQCRHGGPCPRCNACNAGGPVCRIGLGACS